MNLEEAEARAQAAVQTAARVAEDGNTATPVESTGRQMCEEGVTLKFKGRYQTSLSFEAHAGEQGGLDGVAAAIETAWQQDGWNVRRKQLADSPTRELSADDEGFLLSARYFDDPAGGFLRVTAVTPCASPRKNG